jgi:hypothetical protein
MAFVSLSNLSTKLTISSFESNDKSLNRKNLFAQIQTEPHNLERIRSFRKLSEYRSKLIVL